MGARVWSLGIRPHDQDDEESWTPQDMRDEERATDEGMPEAPPPAAGGRAADRRPPEVASLEKAAGDIDGGWVGPTESDDRRGIDDDNGEHDLGGEG